MKQLRKKTSLLLLMALCLPLIFPAFSAAEAGEETYPSALFLNVGKADSAIFFVGGKTYLVDAGTKKSAEAMLRALQTYQVTYLDGVMITHTDKDHVGGLPALLQSGISVDRLYTPRFHTEKNDESHPVYEASQKYGVPMTWSVAGDVISIDEENRFVVLGPLSHAPESDNDNSLVMDLQTPHGNMLLTGDMEFPQETEMLQAGVIPAATVLKVSHHGEDDTSSKLFISTVRPQIAVISTSTEERKRTPSHKVLKLLWDVKATVAVTQDVSCGILVTLRNGEAVAQQIDYLAEAM